LTLRRIARLNPGEPREQPAAPNRASPSGNRGMPESKVQVSPITNPSPIKNHKSQITSQSPIKNLRSSTNHKSKIENQKSSCILYARDRDSRALENLQSWPLRAAGPDAEHRER
jgi:hypothetical protein